jgi:hypothetical protein
MGGCIQVVCKYNIILYKDLRIPGGSWNQSPWTPHQPQNISTKQFSQLDPVELLDRTIRRTCYTSQRCDQKSCRTNDLVLERERERKRERERRDWSSETGET